MNNVPGAYTGAENGAQRREAAGGGETLNRFSGGGGDGDARFAAETVLSGRPRLLID